MYLPGFPRGTCRHLIFCVKIPHKRKKSEYVKIKKGVKEN